MTTTTKRRRKRIKSEPAPDADLARELARLADDGCPHTGERGELSDDEITEVLRKHEAFCWSLARHFAGDLGESAVEEVAAQVRLLLVRAARRFDPNRRFKFITYAMKWARQRAGRGAAIERQRGIHRGVLGRDEKGLTRLPVSLDMAVKGKDDKRPMGFSDMLVFTRDERKPPPPDFWEQVDSLLGGRHRTVIRWRFHDGLTLRECGARLGMSKERVRQLQNQALRRLEKARAVRQLADDMLD